MKSSIYIGFSSQPCLMKPEGNPHESTINLSALCPLNPPPRIYCHRLLGFPIFEGDLHVRVGTLHLSGRWWEDDRLAERKRSEQTEQTNPTWLVVSPPLKNMEVSWDDYSQNMEKHKMCQTTNQQVAETDWHWYPSSWYILGTVFPTYSRRPEAAWSWSKTKFCQGATFSEP